MTDHTPGPTDQRTRVSTEGDRKAYVRDWIARRLKQGGIAGSGLVGTLLTLPMIAAAQAVEGFVNASRIDGVTGLRTMPDGSVQLSMSNGTTISVPATDVQVAANGDVFVSARVEEIAAEVMAAGGGGGAGGGAIIAGLGAGAAVAAAAGGGGGGDGGDGGAPTIAIDDITGDNVINIVERDDAGGITISGSTENVPEGQDVTVRIDGTALPTVQTDANGDWQVTVPQGDPSLPADGAVVTVTADVSDGETDAPQASVELAADFTPPTIAITDTGVGADDTLNLAEQDAGITVSGTTDAEDGQPVTVTLDGAEFTGTVSNGTWSVDIPASGLAGLDPAAADVSVTAEVQDAAGNTGLTFETIFLDLVAPTISLDAISDDNEIGLVDTQGDLEITGTTDAEIGQPVTVTFDGQEFTGSVTSNSLGGAEPNAWSVTVPQSALEALQTQADAGDGTLSDIAVSATVDDAAGNPAAAPATTTIDADFNGPSIAIDPVLTDNGDSVLNIAERDAGFEISGTTDGVADGSPVTVAVNDITLAGPVTVDANGDWSVTVGPHEAGTFPATGAVQIAASATDSTTGLGTPVVTQVLNLDFSAPTIAILNNGLGDDTLNLAEQNSGITVSGSTNAEDGQTVTVRLYDGLTFVNATGTASGGNWSVDIPPADLAQYSGTGPLTITADVEDAAGNPATTASEDVATDLDAPVIAIDPISDDNEIGLADLDGDLEITGTTDAEVGQTVSVFVNNIRTLGEVTAPGVWSASLPQADLLALQTAAGANGILNGIPVRASVSDAAGNPAADATTTIDADFNGPSIFIDSITDNLDNVVNIEERNDPNGVAINGGAVNVEAGQMVTVRIDGTVLDTVPVDALGFWSTTLPQADVAALTDGDSVLVTADVSDAEGVAAPTAEQTLTADFTAPTVAFDVVREDGSGDPGDDDLLNADARTDGFEVAGTASGATGGTVELFLGNNTFPSATAIVQTDGSWSISFTAGATESFFPPADGETPVDLTVVAVDPAGNRSAPETRSITLDDTPPQLTIDAPDLGGDGVLNIAESGSDLALTGQAGGADAITVTLNGSEVTGATLNAAGGWSVDVPAARLQALPSGQPVNITLDAIDAAGNTAQTSTSFDTDLIAPTISITDTGVGPDDIINIAERDAGITVSGDATGAEGQQVTVTLSGAIGTPIVGTGTVTGGSYAVNFSAGQLGNFGGWAAATVTAEVSDAAGNPATPATDSFGIDLSAPTIAFDDLPQAPIVLGIEDRDDPDVSFTTSETAGAEVTLTFTRAGGQVDLSLTEAIENIPSSGGVFDFPLTPAQFAAVQDETDYTVALSITDEAGNDGSTSIDVSTDFVPTLTIDEIGEDGAVDISDTAGASITGTTLGVEQGQQVTVTATGTMSGVVLNATAAVAADGTWDLPVPASVFDDLVPGETFTVDATVDNVAGRTATDAQAGIDAYLAAVYAVANTAEAGTDLTMTAFSLDGLDAVAGIEAIMNFDPGLATYVPGSDTSEFDGLFIVNATNAATGTVSFSGGNISDPIPEGEVLFGFDMEDQGAGPITLSFVDDAQGGPTELQIGTSGADTLTASNTDSVIQGKGGDDQIDVSATGTNIIVFGLDESANGTDTVTGFTTGTSFQADEIAFVGEADLRGAGDMVESLATGGTLGADTGFVIFTTALADTGTSTIETALEGLTGENAGDVFYGLAGDGNDAALVRATVNGTDDIALERLADFEGIGGLNLLSEDNISLPDPATQAV